jgi:Putative prokaryotic signal transducing protein
MTKHCANPACPAIARDGISPEFRDEVEACIDCGGSLMSGAAPDDPGEKPRFSEFRTVFIASDVIQAHLVGGLIESEGIRVYLKGESLSSAIGELPPNVAQIEVQVGVEDWERARLITMRFESSAS